jgi:hypothetical protein
VTDFHRALIHYLHEHIQNSDVPAAERVWALSPEWHEDVKAAADSHGRPLWVPMPTGNKTLFGYPIEIRDDAGVPHLESRVAN